MPDIFDQIEAERKSQPKGDIFDQIATSAGPPPPAPAAVPAAPAPSSPWLDRNAWAAAGTDAKRGIGPEYHAAEVLANPKATKRERAWVSIGSKNGWLDRAKVTAYGRNMLDRGTAQAVADIRKGQTRRDVTDIHGNSLTEITDPRQDVVDYGPQAEALRTTGRFTKGWEKVRVPVYPAMAGPGAAPPPTAKAGSLPVGRVAQAATEAAAGMATDPYAGAMIAASTVAPELVAARLAKYGKGVARAGAAATNIVPMAAMSVPAAQQTVEQVKAGDIAGAIGAGAVTLVPNILGLLGAAKGIKAARAADTAAVRPLIDEAFPPEAGAWEQAQALLAQYEKRLQQQTLGAVDRTLAKGESVMPAVRSVDRRAASNMPKGQRWRRGVIEGNGQALEGPFPPQADPRVLSVAPPAEPDPAAIVPVEQNTLTPREYAARQRGVEDTLALAASRTSPVTDARAIANAPTPGEQPKWRRGVIEGSGTVIEPPARVEPTHTIDGKPVVKTPRGYFAVTEAGEQGARVPAKGRKVAPVGQAAPEPPAEPLIVHASDIVSRKPAPEAPSEPPAATATAATTATAEPPASATWSAPEQVKPPRPAPATTVGPQSHNEDVTWTPQNTEVRFRYEVLPLSAVVPSHTDALTETPTYYQEVQPRERGKVATDQQVESIARGLNGARVAGAPSTSEGAPIIGASDNMVESGNARAMGIRRAYSRYPDRAKAYREWVQANAAQLGLDPNEVSKIEQPVLVRRRVEAPGGEMSLEQRREFAIEAGGSNILKTSAAEDARTDGALVRNAGLLRADAEGMPPAIDSPAFGRKVIGLLPVNEHGALLDEHGMPNKDGMRRVRGAVLAAAVDEPGIVERFLESRDDNIKNVGNGILEAAPDLATVRQMSESGELHDLSIHQELGEASRTLSHLRDTNTKFETWRDQASFEGPRDPVVVEIVHQLELRKRSGQKIAAFLKAYSQFVQKYGHPDQGALFGGDTPTKVEVLQDVIRSLARDEGRTGDLFAPARPTGDDGGVSPAHRQSAGGATTGGGTKTAAASQGEAAAASEAPTVAPPTGSHVSAPMHLSDATWLVDDASLPAHEQMPVIAGTPTDLHAAISMLPDGYSHVYELTVRPVGDGTTPPGPRVLIRGNHDTGTGRQFSYGAVAYSRELSADVVHQWSLKPVPHPASEAPSPAPTRPKPSLPAPTEEPVHTNARGTMQVQWDPTKKRWKERRVGDTEWEPMPLMQSTGFNLDQFLGKQDASKAFSTRNRGVTPDNGQNVAPLLEEASAKEAAVETQPLPTDTASAMGAGALNRLAGGNAKVVAPPVNRVIDAVKSAVQSLHDSWVDTFAGNLARTERIAGPSVVNALRKAGPGASSSTAAAINNASVSAITRALGDNPRATQAFLLELADQNLAGKKQEWYQVADEVSSLDGRTFAKLYGQYDWRLQALEQARKQFEGVPSEVAKLIASGDTEGARAKTEEAFRQAGDNVKRLYVNGKSVESLDLPNTLPGFADALSVYKQFVEQQLRQYHLENAGALTGVLGKHDAYFPLERFASDTQRTGVLEDQTYLHAPRNQYSHFRTGQADAYDVSMEGFQRGVRKRMQSNGRNASIRAMLDAGLIIPANKTTVRQERARSGGTVDVHYMKLNGKEYEADVENYQLPLRVVNPDGTATVLPPQRVAIPLDVARELNSFLPGDSKVRSKRRMGLAQKLIVEPYTATMDALNQVGMIGPLDLTFHFTNQVGVLAAEGGMTAKSLPGKVAEAVAFTRTPAKIGQVVTLDMDSPQALSDIHELARLGVLPSRYGSETFSQAEAAATGAEYARMPKLLGLPKGFGPLLFGSKGFDARARILLLRSLKQRIVGSDAPLYDANGKLAPGVTDAQVLEIAKGVEKMGQYNRELAGSFINLVKDLKIGPFATAAGTMTRNAARVAARPATMFLPKKGEAWTDTAKRSFVEAMTGGTVAYLLTWAGANKALNGKWPWEDEESQLGLVRVPDELAKTKAGQALLGSKPGSKYISLGFGYTMPDRGMRVTGLSAAYRAKMAGGNAKQIVEASGAAILNSGAHVALGGPAAGVATTLAFGADPTLRGMRDPFTGKPGVEVSKSADYRESFPYFKSAAAVSNPFLEKWMESRGYYLPRGKEKASEKDNAAHEAFSFVMQVVAPRLESKSAGNEGFRKTLKRTGRYMDKVDGGDEGGGAKSGKSGKWRSR